ncbi:MAG: transporter substrate-binding domain-containing protein [Cyanobacteria bacterium J06606_4]
MKRLALFVCSLVLTVLCLPLWANVAQAHDPVVVATAAQPTAQSTAPLTAQPTIRLVQNTSEPQRLRVGTKEIFPFVFLENKMPYGYSIELWEEIASDLNIQTEWVRYQSVADMLSGLTEGEVDAAIAGISITAEREAKGFDFSYPFFRSGLQLMTQATAANPVQSLLSRFFSWTVWQPLLIVFATSTVVGAAIWLFEHKHNEHFSQNPVYGIGQGLWFAIVTLGTFGYGDVTPVKLPGRIIACVWMGVSFFIVSYFIASLTVDQLAASSLTFEDLRGAPVGVINNTTSETYVRSQPVDLSEHQDFDSVVEALERGDVEAVVHDYPTLRYLANRNPKKFSLAADPLTREDYGIAFTEDNNDALEIVNQEILALQERGYLQQLKEKWFGSDEVI